MHDWGTANLKEREGDFVDGRALSTNEITAERLETEEEMVEPETR